jgi:glycosyltransferase involved in cell wall biosynthesis
MKRPYAIAVTTFDGQPSVAELTRRADVGEAPRRDYVELARALDAEVIDAEYLQHRAPAATRSLMNVTGSAAVAQIWEAYRRRNDFTRTCLWSDKLGLPLALLHKLSFARNDLVLVSTYLSSNKKAVFLKPLRAHTHLAAIINYSSVQMGIAERRLRVPNYKLYHAMQSVDHRFWKPAPSANSDMICSVGWFEYRDYETLFSATRDLGVRVEVAVGKTFRAAGSSDFDVERAFRHPIPDNVVVHDQLTPRDLRDLYARSRLVVVPVQDVDFDVGATTLGEAMAMAKPVVLTRTRGHADFVTDRLHGLFVPPHDAEAMRSAIEHVLEHPGEAERMGWAGRTFAEENLRVDDYVERVANVIVSAGSAARR